MAYIYIIPYIKCHIINMKHIIKKKKKKSTYLYNTKLKEMNIFILNDNNIPYKPIVLYVL
ncbi:hypothetical protein C923_00158 [Plasmodium falciparum UGT5.1]|uniref:Uncharacterized protein n=2 Tax=Plasmodium falciparum TaxID=5833 RepID=W7K565_PLAFA|nr:hypothetical protein PFNF135_05182 [Plasmodium falciparum NF135/5.C10]EWC79166.1 hypothetical protein C923_00158 [Plasmodium falciparum UGT5.1]